MQKDTTMEFTEIHSIQMALVTGKVACEALRERATFENRSTNLYDEWIQELENALKLMGEKSDIAIFGKSK